VKAFRLMQHDVHSDDAGHQLAESPPRPARRGPEQTSIFTFRKAIRVRAPISAEGPFLGMSWGKHIRGQCPSGRDPERKGLRKS